MQQLTNNARALELWAAGRGYATLVNLDYLYPVYLSFGKGQPTVADEFIPPRGSVTVDGSTSVQGAVIIPFGPATYNIVVEVLEGIITSFGSQGLGIPADAPVYHTLGSGPVGIPTGVLAGNTSGNLFTAGPIPFPYPSWKIGLQCQDGGVAPANPFFELDMQWTEPPNTIAGTVGLATDEDDLIAGVSHGSGAGNFTLMKGSGPSKGSYLQIFLINLDVAVAVNFSIVLLGSFQPITRTSWKQIINYTGASIPNGFNRVAADPARSILIASNFAVVAGTPGTRLMPTYYGKIRGMVDNTGQAATVTVSLLDPCGSGGIPVNTEIAEPVQVGAGNVGTFEANLPPSPVNVKYVSTTGTINPLVTILTEEY